MRKINSRSKVAKDDSARVMRIISDAIGIEGGEFVGTLAGGLVRLHPGGVVVQISLSVPEQEIER